MEYFTKKRLVVILIVVLVLINLTALVTIVLQNRGREHFDKRKSGERNEHADFFKNEIGLDDNQAKKFKELFDGHMNKISETMQKVKDLRIKILDLLFAEKSDSIEIKKLAAEIGTLQSELEIANMNHVLQLKQLCNPEQQKKLMKLFREMPSMKHKKPFGDLMNDFHQKDMCYSFEDFENNFMSKHRPNAPEGPREMLPPPPGNP